MLKKKYGKYKGTHDGHTQYMALKPTIIGLENILMSTGEANIFRKDHDLYHQPDNLFFDPTTKTLYNVEYKSTGNRSKAKKQLLECEEKLHYLFPEYKIENLYITGNYQIKKIKGQ